MQGVEEVGWRCLVEGHAQVVPVTDVIHEYKATVTQQIRNTVERTNEA